VKQAVYKVPNGKLIKIKVQATKQKISQITITGDFFLHPEETLSVIERNLIGCDLEEDTLIKSIQFILEKENAILIGAEAVDFAKAILQA